METDQGSPEDHDMTYAEAINRPAALSKSLAVSKNLGQIVGMHFKQLITEGFDETYAKELTREFAVRCYDLMS
jgi:hypothetical protein